MLGVSICSDLEPSFILWILMLCIPRNLHERTKTTVFPDIEQYNWNNNLLTQTCHHLCPDGLLAGCQFSFFSPRLSFCLFLHFLLSLVILVFLVWLSVINAMNSIGFLPCFVSGILTKSSFLRTNSFTSSRLIVVRFPCLNKEMYIIYLCNYSWNTIINRTNT